MIANPACLCFILNQKCYIALCIYLPKTQTSRVSIFHLSQFFFWTHSDNWTNSLFAMQVLFVRHIILAADSGLAKHFEVSQSKNVVKFCKLDFLPPMYDNLPELVISKSVSIANSVTAVTTKEYFSGKTVAYLREDLLNFAGETNIDKSNHLPPTFEDLNARKPPESIIYFLTGLLERHRHVTPEKTTCLVDSYEADLIYGISNGRFITAKHFVLLMGLSMGLQTQV